MEFFNRLLEDVSLNGARVTDEGMRGLASLSALQTVGVEGTDVSNAGIAELGGIKRLSQVWARKTKVTSAAAEALRKRGRDCEVHH